MIKKTGNSSGIGRNAVQREVFRRTRVALLILAVSLAGCAGYREYRDGRAVLALGDVDMGLTKLRAAMDGDPTNLEYRQTYYMERERASSALVRQADTALDAGDFPGARKIYQRAERIDPSNQRASSGLSRTDLLERNWSALDAAAALGREGHVSEAVTKTQQVLSENPTHRRAAIQLRQLLRQQADTTGKDLGIYPKLKASYRAPVTISFTNATLLQIFDVLKQASGLNYVLDKDIKQDTRVTINVTNKPVEDVLRLVLATNQLERRILDEDTLLIYPNTPAKATEYREMVVRTFYLRNTDATKMAEVLRTIAKVRDVVVDQRLNALVVRDSAESIRLAERLISNQDLAEPEVMLEFEVLEVSVSRLMDLGIQWPDSLTAGVIGADKVAGQLTLSEARNSNSGLVRVGFNDPLINVKLRSTKGNGNLLANPRVRVRNRETAKILIGERVPVITTTATANVGTSQSISYLDVGLKLEVESSVSLDDEVSMKIGLEVSNITQTLNLPGGAQAYRLGTRNTSTTLRVRDGETNVLAGLIQRDERHSNTGIPGLNEAPVVNRLFGVAEDNDSRTEIILLITPHIVRSLDVPGVGQQEFLAGTDSSIGALPIQLGTPMGAATPFRAAPAPQNVQINPQPSNAASSNVTQPANGAANPPPSSGLMTPSLPPPPVTPMPSAPSFYPAPSPPTVPPALTPPTLIPSRPNP